MVLFRIMWLKKKINFDGKNRFIFHYTNMFLILIKLGMLRTEHLLKRNKIDELF